ncbi:hypothetical protein AB205_0063930, partial [Aquarana catesbeiana]
MGQRMYQATQTVECCGPIYNLKVQDNAGQDVMEVVENRACRCSHLVKSRDEQHVVGMIKGEGNQYTVTFPMDMEVTMKAVILASCFYLI